MQTPNGNWGVDWIKRLRISSLKRTPYLTTFEVDGVDALAAFGLSGATLKAGAYIVVPSGDAITAITMSSGSVVIYNQ
jgi:hypothetical protein